MAKGKKHKPEDIIKEKVPFTNIFINRDFSKYDTAIKLYMPDKNLKEVFKDIFEASDLELKDIDEIRKIYFLYFRQHMELISDYKLVKVEFPALGRISPNIDEFCKYIDRISKGFTKSNEKHNNVVDLYNQLIMMLNMLVEEHQHTYNVIGQEHLIKYDDDFIEKKNKEWKRNFYDRNIKFKEVIIDNGLFF